MIATDMREYNYFTYGDKDGYGQAQLSKEIQGSIKMSINTTSQGVQDNILYKDCSYLGLTFDKSIDDTFVIQYGNEKLKVLYVNKKGRYTQVFMRNM